MTRDKEKQPVLLSDWCAQNKLDYKGLRKILPQYDTSITEIGSSLVVSFIIPDSAREKLESLEGKKRKLLTRERQNLLDFGRDSLFKYIFRIYYYRYSGNNGERRFVRYLGDEVT
jgi:aminoglycoside/choline kinase family phosphotransferase